MHTGIFFHSGRQVKVELCGGAPGRISLDVSLLQLSGLCKNGVASVYYTNLQSCGDRRRIGVAQAGSSDKVFAQGQEV